MPRPDRARFGGHSRSLAVLFSVLLLAVGWLTTQVAAREPVPAPIAAIERLFASDSYAEAWFAPAFRAKLPPHKLVEVVAALTAKHGQLKRVERRSGGYLARFATAAVPVDLALDAEGRIGSLLFKPAQPEFADAAAARDVFADLPGDSALLVLDADGSALLALADEARLSVGSAFKLAILAAVNDAVAQGRMDWTDLVALKPDWRSLPTGMLQDWPAGQRLTLESLANLMISRSDNTATDALLALAGRPAVEAIAVHNAPFLDTRSLFVLKAAANRDLRVRWLEGDAAARRAVLAEAAARPLPDVAEVARAEVPKLGWFFSLRELCGLIRQLADLPAMRINPGLAVREAWQSVAFKGGGDQGVLNLTSEVVDKQGRRRCVAATWNAAAPLDRGRFFGLYAALLRLLRDGRS